MPTVYTASLFIPQEDIRVAAVHMTLVSKVGVAS